MGEKIIFTRRIVKSMNRLLIPIPTNISPLVKHGKLYKVTLEPLEDDPPAPQ